MIRIEPVILQPMEYRSKVNKKETKEEHLQRIKKALSYNGKMWYLARKRITAIHKEVRLLKQRLSENIKELEKLSHENYDSLDSRGVRMMDLVYEQGHLINRLSYNKRALLLQSTYVKHMKNEQKGLNREYNKKFKRFYGNK